MEFWIFNARAAPNFHPHRLPLRPGTHLVALSVRFARRSMRGAWATEWRIRVISYYTVQEMYYSISNLDTNTQRQLSNSLTCRVLASNMISHISAFRTRSCSISSSSRKRSVLNSIMNSNEPLDAFFPKSSTR